MRRPLEPIDRAVLQSERRRWPVVMHLELVLTGAADTELLTERHQALCRRYPRIASRVGHTTGGMHAMWLPVDTRPVSRTRTTDRDRTRDGWISSPMDLSRGPALDIVVVDDGSGAERVLLRAHHGALDGQSLRSIAIALGDAPVRSADHGSPADPALVSAASPTNRADVGGEPVTALSALRRVALADRPARLPSARTGAAGSGYGITDVTLDPATTAALTRAGAAMSVHLNDLLVAAMHLAIADRLRSGRRTDPVIRVTVPFSLRVDDPTATGPANRTSQVATTSTGRLRADPEALVRAVADQIAMARSRADPDPIPWVPLLSTMPLRLGGAVTRMGAALTRDAFLDTTRLSNLGRIDPFTIGGVEVGGVVFSPPTRPPQGAAFGVVRHGDATTISIRWCGSHWDTASASAFLADYTDELSSLA